MLSAWNGVRHGLRSYKIPRINIPPPIFPFPIPPAGFPPIPPGTPQPKQRCSDTLGQCSDCEGKQGWCQSGENVSRIAHDIKSESYKYPLGWLSLSRGLPYRRRSAGLQR